MESQPSQPSSTQTSIISSEISKGTLDSFIYKNRLVFIGVSLLTSLAAITLTGGLNSPFFFLLYIMPMFSGVHHRLINPLTIAIFETVSLVVLLFVVKGPVVLFVNPLMNGLLLISPLLVGYVVFTILKQALGQQSVKEKVTTEKEITSYENLLKSEKNQLEEVLHSIEDGVIVTDINGIVTLASRRALELLNTALVKVKGKIIEEVVPGLQLTTKAQEKIDLRSLDGNIFHVSVRKYPLRDIKNQVKGQIYVLRDVSKEDELEEMKLDFVSMAAHQLRTPLTAIKGCISVLIDSPSGNISDEDKGFLDRAMTSSNQLAALVENLLNVTKIEKGKLNVELKPISLEPAINDVISSLTGLANQEQVKLVFEKPSTPTPQVWGDSYLVKEVLTNLISNGIRFNHKGGWVAVSLQQEPTGVVVHIRDNGRGIPPAAVPHLFTKFFKVSDKYIVESKGVGLGLYISKSIIQALGGKIWVNSLEGKGTNFSFSIPLAAKISSSTQ